MAPIRRVDKRNKIIRGTYVVDLAENKCGPDCFLQTTNAGIEAKIFLEGVVPRPASVAAHTSNGSIKLAIPSRTPGQNVMITATSNNGTPDAWSEAAFSTNIPAEGPNTCSSGTYGFTLRFQRYSQSQDEQFKRSSGPACAAAFCNRTKQLDRYFHDNYISHQRCHRAAIAVS